MTEKRIAIISSTLCLLILLCYAGFSSYFANKTLDLSNKERLYFIVLNIATLVLPFLLANLPYLFVRAAAVTGGVLSSFGIFLIIAFASHSSADPKSAAAIWVIYYFWLFSAGIAALYPAIAKPKYVTHTAMKAFIFSCIFTCFVSFLIGLLLSKLL